MGVLRYGWFLLVGLAAQSMASQERLDGIAAVVGDEIILQSEVDAYSMLRLNSLNMRPDSIDVAGLRKSFLQELIDGKVLLVHAKQDTTVSVGNDEVDMAAEGHLSMLLKQNNMTLENLEAELLRQQNMTLAKFKAEIRRSVREQLLKQKVQQLYVGDVKVSRRDVEDFYRQYKDSLPEVGESVRLSKISVALTATDAVRQAAYEKIRSIKHRLDGGASFEALAREYSDSPEGKAGGDLGFIAKGTLSELAFEERAFSTPPGQTSEPFESRLGFHIIKVVAKRDGKVHLMQIFLRVAPDEKQIETITARLDSISRNSTTSRDFVDAVKKFSTDNASKKRGGSTGWSSVLELPGNLRAAVDTLKDGAVTSPVREENAVSIYRVDQRVQSRKLTLEDDWSMLSEKARDILAQRKLVDLVARWRQDVFIDVRM